MPNMGFELTDYESVICGHENYGKMPFLALDQMGPTVMA